MITTNTQKHERRQENKYQKTVKSYGWLRETGQATYRWLIERLYKHHINGRDTRIFELGAVREI